LSGKIEKRSPYEVTGFRQKGLKLDPIGKLEKQICKARDITPPPVRLMTEIIEMARASS